MINQRFWIAVVSASLIGWAASAAFAEDKADEPKQSVKTEKAQTADAKTTGDREEEISLSEVPSLVRNTLVRESTGGQILEVERATKAGKTSYEADVKIDGSTYAVLVAANGKLLSKTLDDDEGDAEDDDGEDDDDDDGEEDDDDQAAKAKTALKR